MNVYAPISYWGKGWGQDVGDLFFRHQMEHDADFSVSPLEITPSANFQGYGEPITLGTAAAIAGILSAIGGGVVTGVTLAQQAKQRRLARDAAKKQKQTAKLQALPAVTAPRAQAADAAIDA